MTVVGLVGAGEMGSALGKVLTDNGAEVRTLLEGRSNATVARAQAAGMRGVSEAEFVRAEFILSVLPPAEAVPFAKSLLPALANTQRKSVYVDCNPLNPAKKRVIETLILETGTPFVDGGVIGPIPRHDYPGPMIYVSGKEARRVEALNQHGLRFRALDAPVGAASALKLSYAAITKGLFAVASAAILGATRAGAADELKAEFAASQPAIMANISRGIPDMVNKTGRWVAEMQEIASYLGAERVEGDLYDTIARLYGHLTADSTGDGIETRQLADFFANKTSNTDPS